MTNYAVTAFPMEMEFPYPKPEIKKKYQRDTNLLLQRPSIEDCFCLDHGPTPEVSYMRYIRSKDALTYDKLQSVRESMALQASDILEHECKDKDAMMNAFHMVDYSKRGVPLGCYTALKPARECETGTPIEPQRIGLTNGKREPELFPLFVKSRNIVDKNHQLIFTNTPVNQRRWVTTNILGRSEYEDTVSRLGLARMRNARQYLEPQPSSRLKSGDPNC